MSFRGPGSSQAKQDLLVVDTAGSPAHMSLPAHTYQIPVVRRYIYLGSLITDSSVSFRAEILHRVRLARLVSSVPELAFAILPSLIAHDCS
eukprot:5281735-Prorocentrum_lima.AAC.1